LEAENGKGEVFGYDRLLAALASAAPGQRLESVKQALADHLGGTSPHDDVSLMVIDCKPAA
jgi:serine phosphatase RsbU (regulator of sigma subunit)